MSGLLGMVVLIGLGFCFSKNRKAISWRAVGGGLSPAVFDGALCFVCAMGEDCFARGEWCGRRYYWNGPRRNSFYLRASRGSFIGVLLRF